MVDFEKSYKKLNKEQKEAVDTIDGAVMVVAGPGTGKTEILALRIGNILKQTDTSPDSILSLTFTNSGVSAMRKRLERYIGNTALKVNVSTFHSFGFSLIEKYYELLDFDQLPSLLSDDETVFLLDDILNNNDWEYLNPKGNSTLYFNDLKQLISVLKRERITKDDLLININRDIKRLEDDPDNISSRGESKGKLKKEIQKKIGQLHKTKEVVLFYDLYEKSKKETSFLDYDDVLEYAVFLAENFENVRDDIRENYLYVLVDEHQDSSAIQNTFLKAIWRDVDMPNIFVVGDDRQLIYAFSGASLSYFEEFSNIFKKSKLIVLKENYRSTAPILSIADDLLKSSITFEKLHSNKNSNNKIMLSSYTYPRDEIIGAGLYFKQKMEEGLDPSECALLVPKNYNVRQAVLILSNMGLPVAYNKSISLFSLPEAHSFKNILNLLIDPNNNVLLTKILLDKISNVPYLTAHNFLREYKNGNFTIDDLINTQNNNLFTTENPIFKFGNNLKSWINEYAREKPSVAISNIGNQLLFTNLKDNDEFLDKVEVIRSFIHLAILFEQKNNKADLSSFILYIERLDLYKTNIELTHFGNKNGINVMTLHKSKGLEYECVWIAHMNEETFMSEKKNNFTLPDDIHSHFSKRSQDEAKRELYVAITRSKEFCVISYSDLNYSGKDMSLLSLIQELDKSHFIIKDSKMTEEEILKNGGEIYINKGTQSNLNIITEIGELVRDHYKDIKISVSMLNNFFECPYKWYFRNFLKIPEIKSVHLSLGTIVHEVIELILKSKKILNTDEIKSHILFILKKENVYKQRDVDRLSFLSLKIINNWIDSYYKNILPDFKSERSVSFVDKKNFPELLMYGKIDLTEYKSNNEIYVTDFKTGKSKTKNEIEKIDEDNRMSDIMRQLVMYSYLLSGNNEKVKITSSRLLFLESDLDDKNASYTTTINHEQIDLLIKDIRDYDDDLNHMNWMNRKCNFKTYGKIDSICPYCEMWGQIDK